MWGKYCCKTSKENDANADVPGCDGSQLFLNSTCCENNNHRSCDNIRGCSDNRGKTLPPQQTFMINTILYYTLEDTNINVDFVSFLTTL